MIVYVFLFMMICAGFLMLFTGSQNSYTRVTYALFTIALIIFLIGFIGVGAFLLHLLF